MGNGASLLSLLQRDAPLREILDFISSNPEAAATEKDFVTGQLPLHVACAKNALVEIVKRLVDAHPDAKLTIDDGGNLPLHWACNKTAQLEIVQLCLATDNLEAAKAKENSGMLPLHVACANNAPFSVIHILVSAYPDATKEKDNNGKLPLHWSCEKNAPLSVIQCVLAAYPQACYHVHGTNKLPIHAAQCATAPDDTVIDILRSLYDAPRSEDVTKFIAAMKKGDSLQLQEALSLLLTSPQLAKLRFEEGPLSWGTVTASGTATEGTCLHLLCKQNVPLESMRCFYSAYPDAVRERDRHSDLPLHTVCGLADVPLDVLRFLLTAYADAVKEKNKDERLPLHVACDKSASFDVIQCLVAAHPEGIKATTNSGRLPLHLACHGKASLEIIQLLLNAHPDAVKVKDMGGQLPLHVACSNNAPLHVIQLLLNAHPDGAKVKASQSGNLPLHLSCEMNAPLHVIQSLVAAGIQMLATISTTSCPSMQPSIQRKRPHTLQRSLISSGPCTTRLVLKL